MADRKRRPTVKGSPLHWAAEYGQPETAATLLDNGADVNLATG